MELNSEDIQAIIPHRPPFLLIDRILELEVGKRAVGLKDFSIDEPYFKGHFPGNPIVPGVLIVEALAQVGSVALLAVPKLRNKLAYFAAINHFRFRHPVVPGDRLRLEVELSRIRGSIGKGSAKATLDLKTVAEGELTFALADPITSSIPKP